MNLKPWKIQKFFGDIVYDLRSRGLLPVAILLVVAMVVVPMLISRGSSSGSGSSLQPTSATPTSAPENEHAVVAYTPAGLRDYKKRLNELSPKDPFRQQFARSAAQASALTSTVSTGGGTTSSSTTTSSTVSGTTGGSTGGTKKKKKKHKGSATPAPATYQVNVLAGDVTTTLTPFNNVASMTALPSQATPVVVFWALSPDYTQALFLVSNKVGTVTGPGTCVPAPDDCALLALKAGESEDLPYSADGKTYRIVVAQINRAG
jgi:hypothetical protein